jgi:hypothetical protein
MTMLFDDDERRRIGAALDALVPGAADLGAVAYVEQLLTALAHDPPRVWAGPDGWLELGVWERHAWAARLETLRAVYRRVLDDAPGPGDETILHAHACEAAYGDPAYGGNRASAGWVRIGFPQPLFPPARSAR